MVWPLINVANVCVEILLIIGFGYFLSWKGIITDKFLPQINLFLLYVSFPCLNLWSIGISLDLRNEEGWRSVAAYIMWITIIQVGILIYVRIFCKGDVGEAALLNLLLSANNTVIIGLPIMNATWGSAGRYISLLTAVALFLQIMPFSIILFEMERWVVTQAVANQNASSNSLIPPSFSNTATGQHSPTQSRIMEKNGPAELKPLTDSPASRSEDKHTSTAVQTANQAISVVVDGETTPSNCPTRPSTPATPGAATIDCLPLQTAALQHQDSNGHSTPSGTVSAQHQEPSPLHIEPSVVVQDAAGHRLPSPSADPTHVHHHARHHQHHHRSVSFASLHDQLQQFFQQASELRARRKQQKRRQREATGVVDIPLPLGPAFHLASVLDPETLDVPASQDGDSTSQHSSHWHDWPWEAWHHLLHASKAGVSKIAGSFSFRRLHSGNDRAQHQHQHQHLNSTAANGMEDKVETPTDRPLSMGTPVKQIPHGPSNNAHPSNINPDHPHLDRHLSDCTVQPQQANFLDDAVVTSTSARSNVRGPSPVSQERGAARQRSFVRAAKVQHAMKRAVKRHGSIWSVAAHFIKSHQRWWQVAFIIFKNPMLWSLILAIIISVSGLRTYLDPTSSNYVMEMGWLVDSLKLLTGTTVPLALFSNGSFLYGKKFWKGNIKKACIIIFLKIAVLPFLQLACAKACQLGTTQAMALIILSIAPTATSSFVVAAQYNHGAEIVTMVTVVLTILLVPLVLAALNLPKALGLYDYNTDNFPLP